ncbi:hypothetical protein SAE01_32330 [Segetibacter aerophilus]|uniref:Uncharacterized protein n=1 Tax=Segetibacter aerophilus TaxID=670293 RepID=A0A512BFX8_9BACT|nr:hypothetical protein SAE01_32330 [Segetibacter aerophilus]
MSLNRIRKSRSAWKLIVKEAINLTKISHIERYYFAKKQSKNSEKKYILMKRNTVAERGKTIIFKIFF